MVRFRVDRIDTYSVSAEFLQEGNISLAGGSIGQNVFVIGAASTTAGQFFYSNWSACTSEIIQQNHDSGPTLIGNTTHVAKGLSVSKSLALHRTYEGHIQLGIVALEEEFATLEEQSATRRGHEINKHGRIALSRTRTLITIGSSSAIVIPARRVAPAKIVDNFIVNFDWQIGKLS